MKDFSLLYGPLRMWLPVVAIVALAMVVYVNQSSGATSDCDPSGPVECSEPLLGERQLLVDGDGLDGTTTAVSGDRDPAAAGGDEAGDDPGPSPWDDFDPSTSEVPIVSLQPSPEPMTEAGEDLVRSAADPDGEAPERP